MAQQDLATAYETAIVALGNVLRSYDTTDQYSVYGFGAKIPPSHNVCSNCFALTGDFLHPQVDGIDGILRAYRRALAVVHLHGPSCPGDVLELASFYAKNFIQEPEKEMLRSSVPPDMNYFVLVVLTDGEIINEKRIVKELKKMQEYPISVFFIGIGTKDFTFWRELSDSTVLNFHKDFPKPKLDGIRKVPKSQRRVARFVKFSEYENDPEGLVKATLAELPQEIVLYYRMLGVKPRGLERFEDKYGEPLPVTLPKAAKGEFNLAQQRTADRIAREKVQSTKTSSKLRNEKGNSKDTLGSQSTPKPESIANLEGGDSTDLSFQNSSHLSLFGENEEEEKQVDLADISSSSEEEKPRKKKNGKDPEDENLPVFLREERQRLCIDASAIGYKRYQIQRALRDGIPSSSMDVLIDNMLYAGYGKLPTFREAALAALADDAPLPWNPFTDMAENKKKVALLDDEQEDYNAQLLVLANPVKPIGRIDVLTPSGVFDCTRSRLSPCSPPLPLGDPAVIPDALGDSLRGPESLSRTATSDRSLGASQTQTRSLEDQKAEDPTGTTAKQVEEAARRLRMHLSRSKSRESEWPSIAEGDERAHVEAPPGEPRGMSHLDPAQLQPSSSGSVRGSTKLTSSNGSSPMPLSRASKEPLLL